DAIRVVDSTFDAFVAREPAPGIAYGLIADGQLVHTRGLGTLQAGITRPVDADSVFRIASMTKSFTGTAITRLRDDGLLRLDEPPAPPDGPARTHRPGLAPPPRPDARQPAGDRAPPTHPHRRLRDRRCVGRSAAVPRPRRLRSPAPVGPHVRLRSWDALRVL